MYSYVVGCIAVLVVFSNPISQVLWPNQQSVSRRTVRPNLNESLIAIEDGSDNILCPPDGYQTHILSKEPLVVYIENFISDDEIAHLMELSEPRFEPSTTTNDGASTHHDSSIRLSDVALLPRTNDVRCIESRARALQGWRRDLWIERLRTQRYAAGGHYAHHFDWSSGAGGWGRVSSFMVWVAAGSSSSSDGEDGVEGSGGGLEGGGTAFPYLRKMSDDKRWCRFVECPEEEGKGKEDQEQEKDKKREGVREGHADEESSQGVVFKAVPGNAVFWENFRADGSGRGYEETFHAGLPVKKGVKVGLNIWSWGRID